MRLINMECVFICEHVKHMQHGMSVESVWKPLGFHLVVKAVGNLTWWWKPSKASMSMSVHSSSRSSRPSWPLNRYMLPDTSSAKYNRTFD